MKILNLYCWIGGNRQLWTPNGDEHEITAVEYNEHIAAVYKDRFPKDTVIVADAHEYLLNNYKEFDFIWASPPCPTHSRLCFSKKEKEYPDMKLYQEIILLNSWYKGKYCIENVIPYYEPLIKQSVELGRHYFWTNFNVPFEKFTNIDISRSTPEELLKERGLDISVFNVIKDVKETREKGKRFDRRQILRNMVNPEVGKYIIDRAMEKEILIQNGLFD